MLPSIDAQADIAIEQTQKLLYPHLQCRKMLLSFLRTGFSQDSVLPQLAVLELLQWAGRCEPRELQMQRGAERLCRRWCRNWYGKPLHGTFDSVSVVRSGRNLQVSCVYGIVTMVWFVMSLSGFYSCRRPSGDVIRKCHPPKLVQFPEVEVTLPKEPCKYTQMTYHIGDAEEGLWMFPLYKHFFQVTVIHTSADCTSCYEYQTLILLQCNTMHHYTDAFLCYCWSL